jgi:hypothetical protein
MAEASKENARLAERLLTIGTLLRDGAPPPAKANGHAAATEEELQTPATWGHVLQAFRELASELKRLERGLAELKARPSMKYCGVWDPEKTYGIGDFVTDDGSIWHCEVQCTGVRPPSSTWMLACKRGKDGRDKR